MTAPRPRRTAATPPRGGAPPRGGPSHGALTGTAPNLTYTPAAGYFGPDSFQFTVSNGTATSSHSIDGQAKLMLQSSS